MKWKEKKTNKYKMTTKMYYNNKITTRKNSPILKTATKSKLDKMIQTHTHMLEYHVKAKVYSQLK